MYYYWVWSNTQRPTLYWLGIDWGPDTHYLNHEPIIVFMNGDGTIAKTVQSGGHRLAFEIDGKYG